MARVGRHSRWLPFDVPPCADCISATLRRRAPASNRRIGIGVVAGGIQRAPPLAYRRTLSVTGVDFCRLIRVLLYVRVLTRFKPRAVPAGWIEPEEAVDVP